MQVSYDCELEEFKENELPYRDRATVLRKAFADGERTHPQDQELDLEKMHFLLEAGHPPPFTPPCEHRDKLVVLLSTPCSDHDMILKAMNDTRMRPVWKSLSGVPYGLLKNHAPSTADTMMDFCQQCKNDEFADFISIERSWPCMERDNPIYESVFVMRDPISRIDVMAQGLLCDRPGFEHIMKSEHKNEVKGVPHKWPSPRGLFLHNYVVRMILDKEGPAEDGDAQKAFDIIVRGVDHLYVYENPQWRSSLARALNLDCKIQPMPPPKKKVRPLVSATLLSILQERHRHDIELYNLLCDHLAAEF